VPLVVVGIFVHAWTGRRLPSCREIDAATGRGYPALHPGLTRDKRLAMARIGRDALEPAETPLLYRVQKEIMAWHTMPTVSASDARRS
jgi:hypothetical protein